MPAPVSFDYAALRVVPRVEREEFVNAGVILFCSERDWLDARVRLDGDKVRALDPAADLVAIEQHLNGVPRLCAGDPDAGPIARLSRRERFHWLVAPRSTMIQPGPVHSGLCEDPEAALAKLFERLVGGSTGSSASRPRQT